MLELSHFKKLSIPVAAAIRQNKRFCHKPPEGLPQMVLIYVASSFRVFQKKVSRSR